MAAIGSRGSSPNLEDRDCGGPQSGGLDRRPAAYRRSAAPSSPSIENRVERGADRLARRAGNPARKATGDRPGGTPDPAGE